MIRGVTIAIEYHLILKPSQKLILKKWSGIVMVQINAQSSEIYKFKFFFIVIFFPFFFLFIFFLQKKASLTSVWSALFLDQDHLNATLKALYAHFTSNCIIISHCIGNRISQLFKCNTINFNMSNNGINVKWNCVASTRRWTIKCKHERKMPIEKKWEKNMNNFERCRKE